MTSSGPVEKIILEKLELGFSPLRLEVENESHMHSSGLGAESHFKVLMVSERFGSVSKVQRQRQVFECLSLEMKQIHALSLRLLTPEEFEATQSEFVSPHCHSKKPGRP